MTLLDLRSVWRLASDVHGLTSSPVAAGSTVLFRVVLVYVGNVDVDGVENLLDFRVESFYVRLVHGVGVLPAVLHDDRCRSGS